MEKFKMVLWAGFMMGPSMWSRWDLLINEADWKGDAPFPPWTTHLLPLCLLFQFPKLEKEGECSPSHSPPHFLFQKQELGKIAGKQGSGLGAGGEKMRLKGKNSILNQQLVISSIPVVPKMLSAVTHLVLCTS